MGKLEIFTITFDDTWNSLERQLNRTEQKESVTVVQVINCERRQNFSVAVVLVRHNTPEPSVKLSEVIEEYQIAMREYDPNNPVYTPGDPPGGPEDPSEIKG